MHPFLSSQIAVQVSPYPSRVFSHLIFYALSLVQVKRDQKPLNHWGPSQDCKSSQWTLDSKGPFLKTWRRWYLGGRTLISTGDCSLRDKIFIFPECQRRMRCHASISYTVAPENIPIFIQKFFISVQQVICAFKSI